MAIIGADGALRGEPDAVIFDLQNRLIRAELQFDSSPVRAGMLDDVGERFLADAQQVFLYHFRQEPRRAFGLQLHLHTGGTGNLAHAVGQGAGQVELREGPATQIPHRTAHLHLAHGHEITRQLQVVERAMRIALVELRGSVQLQGDARERLFHRIVQFLRQARPLGQHAFELKLGFLARGDLKLELLRPFYDSLFQLVVGLLELDLGLLPFANQIVQG